MNVFARVVLALGLVLPAPLMAQEQKPCGDGERSWLRLRIEGWSPDTQSLLMKHVRSSLAARDLDVCVSEAPAATSPLATLEVVATSPGGATSLVIDDSVTHKRVSREIDVSSVEPDARPLMVALALDELLRASWAELMLPDVDATPAPKVVTAALPPKPEDARVLKQATPSSWVVGGVAAFEHFGGGQDQVGADLVANFWPLTRLGFDARLGWRWGAPAHAPRGDIHSTALSASLGPVLALTPRTRRAGLSLFGDVRLIRGTFVAEPSAADVRGNERSVITTYLEAGVGGWIALASSVQLRARLGAGVPLHTAYAVDGDVRVTGYGGVLVAADVGVAISF